MDDNDYSDIFYEFKNVSIHDHDANANLILKYKRRMEELTEESKDSVDNYDAYISSVHDYVRALGVCRVIGEHIKTRINVENYTDETEYAIRLYHGLKSDRGSVVRQIRRTGQNKNAGDACQFCKTNKDLHSHHIIPLYLGGTDDPDNFITVCSDCHRLLHNQISSVVKHVKGEIA